MKMIKYWMIAIAITFVPSMSVRAAYITVSRLNTDDIVIPTFDTNLGTLTDVKLTVTLLPGTTNIAGGHDHSSYQLTSLNTFISPFGMSPTSRTSSTYGGHTYSILTPTYSGGGLNIGNFSFSTALDGAHSHTVSITPGGYAQVGSNAFRAFAVLNPSPYNGDSASYGGASKVLNYSGLDVSPFLALSDIVIGASTFGTASVGAHNHSVPSFSVGPWNFSASSLSTVGPHSHLLNPRFDVIAEFTYTETPTAAVPEPSSLGLVGSGLVWACGAIVRRRRRPASDVDA